MRCEWFSFSFETEKGTQGRTGADLDLKRDGRWRPGPVEPNRDTLSARTGIPPNLEGETREGARERFLYLRCRLIDVGMPYNDRINGMRQVRFILSQ